MQYILCNAFLQSLCDIIIYINDFRHKLRLSKINLLYNLDEQITNVDFDTLNLNYLIRTKHRLLVE